MKSQVAERMIESTSEETKAKVAKLSEDIVNGNYTRFHVFDFIDDRTGEKKTLKCKQFRKMEIKLIEDLVIWIQQSGYYYVESTGLWHQGEEEDISNGVEFQILVDEFNDVII